MIVVSELVFSDGGHVPFNAGLLTIVRTAFPFESVCFVGASGHIRELKKQVGEELSRLIEWQELILLPPSVPYFSRLVSDMKILQTLLRIIPEGGPGLVLVAHAKPATLVALKLLKGLKFREINVQVVLHGQLGGVIGRRHRHPIHRFQEVRTALTILGNDKLQYIVLEEGLRAVLIKNIPALKRRVHVLPHPLPPNEAKSTVESLRVPVQFGFLGLTSKGKGFPVFVKLARKIMISFRHQAEFHAIGRAHPDEPMVSDIDVLVTKPVIERLSRQDYIQAVIPLHFIVFPHQATNYQLTASGTLLDALAWAKPLIARRIELFENMFSEFGDIGYLFSTDLELESVVERIVQEMDFDRYHQQVLNIQRARCSRDPKVLSAVYQKICQEIRG
ncbi:MAG: hypothetical protein NPIRA04_28060 [Nitrospirales bacterium]|nr:MAG: hypothetical protein NPIRA04_28060 [Nitrospirales bacterium]